MKRRIFLTIILLLIVFVSIILKFKLDNRVFMKKEQLSFQEYDLKMESYENLETIVYDNKIYTLYEKDEKYILKEINTLTNKVLIYKNDLAFDCKIVEDYNNSFISCSSGSYSLDFKRNDINKKNNENIFESGTYLYEKNKIKINDMQKDEYKEYNLDIEAEKITIGGSTKYTYILKENCIYVYNLKDNKTEHLINIDNILDEILNLITYNSKLYIITNNKVYSYDISSYENNLKVIDLYLNEKVKKIEDTYDITISFSNDLNLIHSDYEIDTINDFRDVLVSLGYFEDFLVNFNKQFFVNFKKNDMNGISFYLVNDIVGTNNGYETTDVVGLSYKKGNDYIIIVKLNSEEDTTKILSHELMHIIDIYYDVVGINTLYWDSLNPDNFEYSHVYNSNLVFKDTLNYTGKKDNIYFIDSYGRSSKKEDRARIFEALMMQEYYDEYPNLNKKINCLKAELQGNF